MSNENINSQFRYYGQLVVFALCSLVVVFGLLGRISLDWKAYVILLAFDVLLILPWISEINIFDVLKIKKGIDETVEKLRAIEAKIEVSSNSKAQNSTYNFNVNATDLPSLIKDISGKSETGGSTQ